MYAQIFNTINIIYKDCTMWVRLRVFLWKKSKQNLNFQKNGNYYLKINFLIHFTMEINLVIISK